MYLICPPLATQSPSPPAMTSSPSGAVILNPRPHTHWFDKHPSEIKHCTCSEILSSPLPPLSASPQLPIHNALSRAHALLDTATRTTDFNRKLRLLQASLAVSDAVCSQIANPFSVHRGGKEDFDNAKTLLLQAHSTLIQHFVHGVHNPSRHDSRTYHTTSS